MTVSHFPGPYGLFLPLLGGVPCGKIHSANLLLRIFKMPRKNTKAGEMSPPETKPHRVVSLKSWGGCGTARLATYSL